MVYFLSCVSLDYINFKVRIMLEFFVNAPYILYS